MKYIVGGKTESGGCVTSSHLTKGELGGSKANSKKGENQMLVAIVLLLAFN